MKSSTKKSTRGRAIDYLERASEGGQVYLADMHWAMRYASENRLLMINRTADLVEESLNSSSHGAGRTMSRSESFENLQVKRFKAKMGSIVFRKEHADRLLDESPAAYRRLSEVMQAQCDLVATRDTLKTVLNYKSL